ncbi:MAG: hypothetical protein ACTSRW_09460 [Candidatus Helarchaeota archaeon]
MPSRQKTASKKSSKRGKKKKNISSEKSGVSADETVRTPINKPETEKIVGSKEEVESELLTKLKKSLALSPIQNLEMMEKLRTAPLEQLFEESKQLQREVKVTRQVYIQHWWDRQVWGRRHYAGTSRK